MKKIKITFKGGETTIIPNMDVKTFHNGVSEKKWGNADSQINLLVFTTGTIVNLNEILFIEEFEDDDN